MSKHFYLTACWLTVDLHILLHPEFVLHVLINTSNNDMTIMALMRISLNKTCYVSTTTD